MAENQFVSTVEALFKGMDQFVTTKTVVGDAVKVDDAIILPLVDVTCGMAAGSFADNAKHNGGGGMSAKMSPSAVLVIQNGVTKLVNIKQQDARWRKRLWKPRRRLRQPARKRTQRRNNS